MREEETRQSEERERNKPRSSYNTQLLQHAAPTRDGVKRFGTYRILVRNAKYGKCTLHKKFATLKC